MDNKTDATLKLNDLLKYYESEIHKSKSDISSIRNILNVSFNNVLKIGGYYINELWLKVPHYTYYTDLIREEIELISSILTEVYINEKRFFEIKCMINYLKNGDKGIERFNAQRWKHIHHITFNEYLDFMIEEFKKKNFAEEYIPQRIDFNKEIFEPIQFTKDEIIKLLFDYTGFNINTEPIKSDKISVKNKKADRTGITKEITIDKMYNSLISSLSDEEKLNKYSEIEIMKKDIAELCGVNKAKISRVIKNKEEAEKFCDKIKKRINSLQFLKQKLDERRDANKIEEYYKSIDILSQVRILLIPKQNDNKYIGTSFSNLSKAKMREVELSSAVRQEADNKDFEIKFQE